MFDDALTEPTTAAVDREAREDWWRERPDGEIDGHVGPLVPEPDARNRPDVWLPWTCQGCGDVAPEQPEVCKACGFRNYGRTA